MFRSMFVFSFVSLATLCSASEHRDICGIQVPPAKYKLVGKHTIDGPYYPDLETVAKACLSTGVNSAVGCTTHILFGDTVIASRILIASHPPAYVSKKCTVKKWKASILRHELAHVAGWPPNHPY